VEAKRRLIEPEHREIPVWRQCELLGLNRSSYYYQPARVSARDDLALMQALDRLYTAHPYYGIRRLTAVLRQAGQALNPKRVRRLMRSMGLEALYPRRSLSGNGADHPRYPYLLRDLPIVRPDQVWTTDITYIRLRRGHVYLVAILDWYSRYVVSWELSIGLTAEFCVSALDRALVLAVPEIFNSDQGPQFTSAAFLERLTAARVRISMDGRGRVYDNIFVERLWRTVKYEEVYLNEYETVRDALLGLGRYFEFYNHQRPHQSLGYRSPAVVYHGRT